MSENVETASLSAGELAERLGALRTRFAEFRGRL